MQRFLRLCTGLLRACVRLWWNRAFVEGGDRALCSLHLSYNYIHAVLDNQWLMLKDQRELTQTRSVVTMMFSCCRGPEGRT